MQRVSILLIFCLLASLGFTQSTLTPENLWKLNRVYGEQVSPSGDLVLFNVKTYDLEEDNGTAQLFIMKSTGSDIQMISQKGESIYDAQWRPDGKKIGFLSRKSGSMQLWEMNPDGTERRQVTKTTSDIANWHYAPDAKHISFTMQVKIESSLSDKYPDLPKATGRAYDNLMYRHWTQWHDYHYSHLFIAAYDVDKGSAEIAIDIMPDEPYDTPLAPFGGGSDITWSPDGKSLIYVCKKKLGKEWAVSTNADLYQYTLASKQTRNLTSFNKGYDTGPVFSPSGKYLAWLSMARDGFESDKNIVRLLNLSKGNHISITEDIDQTFGNLVWGVNEDRIWTISPIEATYQICEIGLNKEKKRAHFKVLTEGTHNINSIQRAGKHLLGTKSSMSAPNELFSWNFNGDEEQITFMNKELLEGLTMGRVEKRMIPTTDGKEMLTWIIYPPEFDPEKQYPTLLYCQGGPQSAVSQFFSYRWNFQLMAANGYIIVAPNRRGLPSFGQEWNDQISEDWGGQAMDDYLSAIDAVAEDPYVDNDRLGAVGASYGGYSVYYLAGIHEGRFSTFISHCGLFNLESWYASTEELFFANWDIGGPYWKTPIPKSYAAFSPHKLVANWNTPIMVIHNELDFRVPLNQGLEAFTAAQLNDIPSKLLYYPDEGHWVLKPQNGVLWHREFYDWLDKWLKP